MADISDFSIVTFLRKPGHWRAAIFPKARIKSAGGETVLSVVTPDDFASEAGWQPNGWYEDFDPPMTDESETDRPTRTAAAE